MGIPYILSYLFDPKPVMDVIRAELASPVLDSILHPEGKVVASFETRFNVRKDGLQSFEIDSFQLNSLIEYIEAQGLIRYALQAELNKERSTWCGKDYASDDGELWNNAKIISVSFNLRHIQTVKSLTEIGGMHNTPLPGLTGEEIESMVAMSDKPETRATFTVVVQVAWDDDHGPRLARFRDGAFVDLVAQNG